MVVRSKSVGGIFAASNSTQIVDMLSAPAELRGNKLLGVNFTATNPDSARCVMALSRGKFAQENIGTGPWQTVNATDPFGTAQFLSTFAHAGVTGGGLTSGSHYVPLHGLVIVEQIDLLVYLPTAASANNFVCDLYYEPVKMSSAEWADLRHRPSDEHAVIGSIAV